VRARPAAGTWTTAAAPVTTAARIAALTLIAVAAPIGTLTAQIPDSSRAALTAPDSVIVTDSLMITDSLGITDTLFVRPPLPEEVVVHLSHLTTTFSDTPQRMGLIPAGMAEAVIAGQYAWLAGQDSADIMNMTSSMTHVLHAIDPSRVTSGYGLGYGFKRAAQNVITHMELAEAADSVSEALLFHAPFVLRAARGAVARADRAIAMAQRIQRGTDPEETLGLIDDLRDLVRAMAYGADRDRDGRVGQTEAEVGLAQAWYHLQLICRVEDLYMPALAPFPLATDSLTAGSLRYPDRTAVPIENAFASVTDTIGVVMDSTSILTERMRGCD